MTVAYYDLDRRVFNQLLPGVRHIEIWQGAASGIADYASSWGLERFWATSRSMALLGGGIPSAGTGDENQRRYFAWGVARVVLCEILGTELAIQSTMTTEQFQARLGQLSFNQQVLLTELLIEVAETIQFWTMRLKDAEKAGTQP